MYKLLLKRAIDIVLAMIMLIALLPLMLLISLIVWRDLGSPVIFQQTRPGLKGRPFSLKKYRTMVDDLDSSGNPNSDSERLTKIGRLLRSTSLDELPEIFNVIKGDMSMVGPRPLLMKYLDRYSRKQMRRHEVKPGITGWAQVNGRNTLSWETKFELDVWYVDNLSFMLDMKIMVLTIWTILRKEGINKSKHVTIEEFTGGHH